MSLQVCDAVGFAPVQKLSATSVPSERWQLTVRDCEPLPHVFEHVPHVEVVHAYVKHACVLQACVVVGALPVQPNEPVQLCAVGGFAPAHDASATTVPSERWHTTVRDCVPDVFA